ncbi:MAG: queuosine 5'-phosphate N-glycosylase/hydrolase [Ktedonobacterales bacterium]
METTSTVSGDPYNAIQPPDDDRLGVLTATSPVVHAAQYVRLDGGAIARCASRWAGAPWPDQAGLDALHFADGTERTANWILLLDALNFCFWGEPGQPRWRVEWHGQTLDGYAALAAALSRAVENGRPLWDAAYLADLTYGELQEILRPVAGSPEIPLFEARLTSAREVGRVLLAHYEGRFVRAYEAAGGSAVSLALLLAREFSSFADIAEWRGTRVPFLKRAQICVADLDAAFHGQQWGAFDDLAALTAFADYKLPQLLRSQNVLIYAPELAARIDAYEPISAGSEEEIEIRAATVWAVELLRRAFEQQGISRPASAIDYRLWAESQAHTISERPYHRTRTLYY